MIIPDVHVLVYAFKRESPDHEAYAAWLQEVVTGEEDLGLVDASLLGFARIVTNPRIFAEPARTVDALALVDALRSAPIARSLQATAATWSRLDDLAAHDRALRGNLVPDAHLAAVALTHGGRVATADRGFSRFPGLRWFDPVAA